MLNPSILTFKEVCKRTKFITDKPAVYMVQPYIKRHFAVITGWILLFLNCLTDICPWFSSNINKTAIANFIYFLTNFKLKPSVTIFIIMQSI